MNIEKLMIICGTPLKDQIWYSPKHYLKSSSKRYRLHYITFTDDFLLPTYAITFMPAAEKRYPTMLEYSDYFAVASSAYQEV